jgi:nucleoside-diphosphate-sugar epimerase
VEAKLSRYDEIVQQSPSELTERLAGKTVLVTGATGLLGSSLVDVLSHLGCGAVRVLALVRDQTKAHKVLRGVEGGGVELIIGDVSSPIEISGPVDYIIHAASPTASEFFVTRPVETMDTIIAGTRNVLELARQKRTQSVVFLSSMEVYGTTPRDELLDEQKQGYLDPLSMRSSYPQAKRTAELLCAANACEHGVPVKTVRLAQVIADEIDDGDTRLMAQLVRAYRSGNDIVLETDGSSKQTYIGLLDAITAVFYVLLRGQSGQSYNAANDQTYCSIRGIAEFIARDLSRGSISVVTNGGDTSKYPPQRTLRLNSSKLEALGWAPSESLDGLLTRRVGSGASQ